MASKVSRRAGSIRGTSGGLEVDEVLIDRLAREAEAGFDVSHIRDGGRGRPSLGSEPARTVHVKVEQPLYEALARRAEADSVPVSQVVRRALRRYLVA